MKNWTIHIAMPTTLEHQVSTYPGPWMKTGQEEHIGVSHFKALMSAPDDVTAADIENAFRKVAGITTYTACVVFPRMAKAPPTREYTNHENWPYALSVISADALTGKGITLGDIWDGTLKAQRMSVDYVPPPGLNRDRLLAALKPFADHVPEKHWDPFTEEQFAEIRAVRDLIEKM